MNLGLFLMQNTLHGRPLHKSSGRDFFQDVHTSQNILETKMILNPKYLMLPMLPMFLMLPMLPMFPMLPTLPKQWEHLQTVVLRIL